MLITDATPPRRSLTPKQILEFLDLNSTIDREISGLHLALEAEPEILGRIESALFGWGAYYELPYQAQVGWVLKYMGVLEPLRAAATSEDPYAALIAMATEELPAEHVLPESQTECLIQLFGLVVSLRNSIRSVGHFGKWLSELLALAKSGNDDALLKAISIDHCVLGAPYVQHRLALAAFRNDRRFVEAVSKALLGPSKKISPQINKVRIVGKLLVDDGSLPESNDELVALFCNKLKIYPSTGDPAKALRKLLKVVTPSSTT